MVGWVEERNPTKSLIMSCFTIVNSFKPTEVGFAHVDAVSNRPLVLSLYF